MKIEFQNLGTIKKTVLDLRPLTVIVGPNNTNKTYLAYCVHGLMHELEQRSHFGMYLPTGKSKLSLSLSDLLDHTQTYINHLSIDFVDELPEYFQDSYGGLFKSTKLGIRVGKSWVRAALQAYSIIAPNHMGLVEERVVIPNVARNLERAALAALAQSVVFHGVRTPLTLPAERNAFVITYKMLSARRYRVLRDRERARGYQREIRTLVEEAHSRNATLLREQGDIRYPGPIEDFLDFLTDVELEAARPRNDAKTPFGKLAHTIEAQIQGGHRTGYEQTTLGGSELALTVSDKLRLDLYNASSSVKQLAPLLLYLRYRAAPGQLLIIDEPEMNLHPEAQAKLLEALGMLANLGVHVLLTTHSPYFMAHLNNLIAADMNSPARKKRQAKHLYIGDQAAFLSPDQVSAYEMRTDGLVSLADPEYGIRWDTLSDVSSELQRRYFAIVEEPKGRGKKAK